MTQPAAALITTLLAKSPEWLRRDLASQDAALRERAADTLAAMIATALSETTNERPHSAQGQHSWLASAPEEH